jgi:uncharacterized membrane protein
MKEPKWSRLAYIDWMRGLACVLMFQTHCYDSWLSPSAKKTTFFMWSQLLGTLPAPLFLFVAGISFALVATRLRKRGAARGEVMRATVKRGTQILGLGLLFRLQEYVIAWPWAPWTDLLRVDILNNIGVSMILMSAIMWLCMRVFERATKSDGSGDWNLAAAISAGVTAVLIALLTPFVWTTARPDWLPWPVQSYLDGVHNLGKPQAWLFPIFPWTGFAFAGLAVGSLLFSGWAKLRESLLFMLAIIPGLLCMLLGKWLDRGPQLYPVYDFWHTSPNFFLIRLGLLLVLMSVAYGWCRWATAQSRFSPLMQLGQTSLLVYWVHIEFVYGRFSILKKGRMSIAGASAGLIVIFLSMLLLSTIRTRLKGRLHLRPPAWGRAAARGEQALG